MTQKKSWKKLLYLKQGYPDNYTEEKIFLSELKKNIDYKHITLQEAIFGSTLIVQEICNVLIFLIVYLCLIHNWIEPTNILLLIGGTTCFGFIWYAFNKKLRGKTGNHIRTAITYVVFGQLFSPVLHTLTDSVSTDTIYTMSFLMMIIHLIFFHYGVLAAIISKSISLSAAIFASICLTSRVSSGYEAFILMTASTEIFVLLPIFQNELTNNRYFSVLVILFTTFGLSQVSHLVLVLFLIIVIFINVICPYLFIKFQTYKENIYGPWDEAIVNDINSYKI